MRDFIKPIGAFTVVASLLLAAPTLALDLTAGYVVGGNDPLQLGSDFVIDQAQTGGGDYTTGDGFFTWAAQYTDMWDVGTSVSLTGIAIPLQGPVTETGDFTFTFFELDGGANPNAFDGYDFGTMTGETVLGSVTATYTDADVTDEYFVQFDTPINFTSASTGVAFHVQSTAAVRTKIRGGDPAFSRAERVLLADGSAIGGQNRYRATLAGTPPAFVIEPPPPFPHRFDASTDSPGDLVWDPVSPSAQQFNFAIAPVQGDYNGDGAANLADYTVWRDNLGGDAATVFAAGSRDPGATNPVIDADDYSFWKSTFGAESLSPAPIDVNDSAVPGITKAYDVGSTSQVDYEGASRADASFEVWFKPNDLAGGDQIIFEAGGGASGIYFSLQDDSLSFFAKSAFEGNDQTLSTTLSTAEWTQVVGVIHNTYDAVGPSADDYLDLYINGQLISSNELSTTDINDWAGGNPAGLGQDGSSFATGGPLPEDTATSGEYPFAGQIAIMEFIGSALTAQDVQDRYDAITMNQGALNAVGVPEPSTIVLASLLGLIACGAHCCRN